MMETSCQCFSVAQHKRISIETHHGTRAINRTSQRQHYENVRRFHHTTESLNSRRATLREISRVRGCASTMSKLLYRSFVDFNYFH